MVYYVVYDMYMNYDDVEDLLEDRDLNFRHLDFFVFMISYLKDIFKLYKNNSSVHF